MSERPFMQLYVSDFVGDTLHLSTEQVGAYLLLLMAMWNADGALPNDSTKLARVARSSVENWPSLWLDLAPYFDVTDSHVTHGRLARELAKFARKSASRSEAGRKGAAAKALKSRNAGQAIASGLLKHSPETRIKGRATLRNPTEKSAVKLDRYADEVLFKACEAVSSPVPEYIQFKSFPIDVVEQARSLIATKGVPN